MTDRFLIYETYPSVSDWKDRDELGMYYLGLMNVECDFCGDLGLRSEIQDICKRCGVTYNPFGDLCCCQGKMNGITDYILPDNLSDLYTSKQVLSKPPNMCCKSKEDVVQNIGQYLLVLHKLDSKYGDRNCLLILPCIPMECNG